MLIIGIDPGFLVQSVFFSDGKILDVIEMSMNEGKKEQKTG